MVKSAKANLRASHVALVQGQRTVGIWVGIANGRMVMRDLIVLKAWRIGRLYSKNPNSVHHPITPDELADMQTLKRSGATYREIGEMYGLDKETVHGRLRRYSSRSA